MITIMIIFIVINGCSVFVNTISIITVLYFILVIVVIIIIARRTEKNPIVFVISLCCRLPPKLGETAKVYR